MRPVTQALASAGPPASPSSAAPTADRLPVLTAGPAAPRPPEATAAPVRLLVPDLGIDVRVDPVGVRDDGQMAIPDDVDRVGWYRFGAAPGDAGSAVVAGHVDDAEQGLGALAPLRTAEPGAEVRVTDEDGTTTRWRVVSRELITKRVLPLAQIVARGDGSRLRVELTAPDLADGYDEVWLLEPGAQEMFSIGVVRSGTTTTLDLPPGIDLDAFPVVDVSVEQLDGDPTHSGVSVARGVLDS